MTSSHCPTDGQSSCSIFKPKLMPPKCRQGFLAFEVRTSLRQRSAFFLSLPERMPHAHLRFTSHHAPSSRIMETTQHSTSCCAAVRRVTAQRQMKPVDVDKKEEASLNLKLEISSMQSIAASSALIASKSLSSPSLRARHNAAEARWHVARRREGVIGRVNFKLI